MASLLISDTLSMGEGVMEKPDHHSGQVRPRQQMIDYSISHKSILEPTFDVAQATNVTALIGKTAYLTCRVRHLGNKTVCSIYVGRRHKNEEHFVGVLQCKL